MEFTFLTKAEVAALSAEARTQYEADLAAFVTAFMAQNPNGETTVEATIVKMNAMATIVNGKPRVAMNLAIGGTIGNAVTGKNGLILRPLSNADIVAKNAGFLSYGHMALVLGNLMNKGKFVLTVKLNVKGERWESKDGRNGLYENTHMAIVDFVYEPSTAASQTIGAARMKAASAGFEQMLFSGYDATATVTPVAVPVEASTNADDLNP